MNTVQPAKPINMMQQLMSKLGVIGLMVCVTGVSSAQEIKSGESVMGYQNQAAWQKKSGGLGMVITSIWILTVIPMPKLK